MASAGLMLALKLLLVPTLLAAVTLAGRRWGQRTAGWLGSFPIVAGPILLILAIEHGAPFAALAAERAMAAIAATMAFFVVLARLAPRLRWASALGVALIAWVALVAALSWLPATLPIATLAAVVALALAPLAMGAELATPAATAATGPTPSRPSRWELPSRMLAGAALALITSHLGARFGPETSGYAALFPVVGATAAGFNLARQGAPSAVSFLRGMNRGMWSVAVFCGVLSLALLHLTVPAAFGIALLATVVSHAIVQPRSP
ncbi:MAG: hypothetical protein NTV91_03065 [Proteobacteria bacterium]|nr:hypothetical protein [Pseudomonadota bacterium]